MEFIPAVAVTLLVYTAFVIYFMRLVGMLRRNDGAVVKK